MSSGEISDSTSAFPISKEEDHLPKHPCAWTKWREEVVTSSAGHGGSRRGVQGAATVLLLEHIKSDAPARGRW